MPKNECAVSACVFLDYVGSNIYVNLLVLKVHMCPTAFIHVHVYYVTLSPCGVMFQSSHAHITAAFRVDMEGKICRQARLAYCAIDRGLVSIRDTAHKGYCKFINVCEGFIRRRISDHL